VFGSFKKLLNPNPKIRLSAKKFLESGMMDGGFFATNRLVQVCSSLDNFTLASEVDKNALLKSVVLYHPWFPIRPDINTRTLKESASSFPPEFASYRVLPSLISALEFGGVSASTLLPLVLLYGANVSPVDIQKMILDPIVKLYASPDRGTRIALLDCLPEYVDKLDKKTVSDKVFPHLVSPSFDISPYTDFFYSNSDFRILLLLFGKPQLNPLFCLPQRFDCL